jgi:hypothetical protein
MSNRYLDSDAAADLLQRRWFAAFKAASAVRAECEALLESMAVVESAWSRARARLCELEGLRDALGEELALAEGGDDQPPKRILESVMSAA